MELDVHVIVDNYGTHKHPRVKRWLAPRPRFKVHFTPTYASWLNQVEIWFNRITQQGIRRGTFRSVKRTGRENRSVRPGNVNFLDAKADAVHTENSADAGGRRKLSDSCLDCFRATQSFLNRKSFRPTASRTCGTSTKTPNQNQTQIPCTCKRPLEKTMETDISIWQKPGHFYFALTRSENTKRELLAG